MLGIGVHDARNERSRCVGARSKDCNDGNSSVNPAATELPGNGVDDDCNAGTPGCTSPQLAEAGVGAPGPGTSGLGGSLGAAAFLFVAIRAMRRRP